MGAHRYRRCYTAAAELAGWRLWIDRCQHSKADHYIPRIVDIGRRRYSNVSGTVCAWHIHGRRCCVLQGCVSCCSRRQHRDIQFSTARCSYRRHRHSQQDGAGEGGHSGRQRQCDLHWLDHNSPLRLYSSGGVTWLTQYLLQMEWRWLCRRL